MEEQQSNSNLQTWLEEVYFGCEIEDKLISDLKDIGVITIVDWESRFIDESHSPEVSDDGFTFTDEVVVGNPSGGDYLVFAK